MKIGVFGGTFDPPHRGLLQLALVALERFKFDEILWIPTFSTPLRKKVIDASPEDRLEMVRLMIFEEQKMGVSDIEITREETSYMVDTLSELQQARAGQYWLILDSNTALQLKQWKNTELLVKLCRFAVGVFPDFTEEKIMSYLSEALQEKVDFFSGLSTYPDPKRIQESLISNIEPERWLTPSVLRYITQKGLYQ